MRERTMPRHLLCNAQSDTRAMHVGPWERNDRDMSFRQALPLQIGKLAHDRRF
jgi:hypothetical protein